MPRSVSCPISLSLAGDGRFVVLTPQTVRKAFFQFTSVNRGYTAVKKQRLNYSCHQKQLKTKSSSYSLLDALYRQYLDKQELSFLSSQDISCIETEINKRLIFDGLALVENEGQLLRGYGLSPQPGNDREKVLYILRYGLIFILEPILRHHLLQSKQINLFIQDRDFDLHYVYFQGLVFNPGKLGQLLFRHPLDLDLSWAEELAKFKPRQILRVKHVYPCSGFAFDSAFTPTLV